MPVGVAVAMAWGCDRGRLVGGRGRRRRRRRPRRVAHRRRQDGRRHLPRRALWRVTHANLKATSRPAVRLGLSTRRRAGGRRSHGTDDERRRDRRQTRVARREQWPGRAWRGCRELDHRRARVAQPGRGPGGERQHRAVQRGQARADQSAARDHTGGSGEAAAGSGVPEAEGDAHLRRVSAVMAPALMAAPPWRQAIGSARAASAACRDGYSARWVERPVSVNTLRRCPGGQITSSARWHS
jgi:hypothetical protein